MKIDETQFAHSVARIRVLETKLLNDNEMERMVLAKDAHDAYRILNELDYSTYIGDTDDIETFEKVINAGLHDTKELIHKITPYKWIFNILWYMYDFHNIKVLLKSKALKQEKEEYEAYLIPYGAINIDKLQKYIIEGEDVGFDIPENDEKYLKESYKLAEADFNKSSDPQLIDLILDKRYSKIAYNIAFCSGNEFLIKFVKKYIDLMNIELFVRLKVQDRDESLLEQGLINRGFVPRRKFLDSYKKDLNDFVESMRATDYIQIIQDGMKGYEDEKSFVKLEKLSFDHLTGYIQTAKRIAMGPEPIFAYFWAKKNNALILRTIMVNKSNDIDPDVIKKILRNLY